MILNMLYGFAICQECLKLLVSNGNQQGISLLGNTVNANLYSYYACICNLDIMQVIPMLLKSNFNY